MKPARIRVNPPRGRRPVLQNIGVAELAVDPEYQRDIDNGASRALIRSIARDWNWGLCQPLVIAQRADGLFVVDGQHRLAAARLRGDIGDLPCVVTAHASVEDEAAAFVALNQKRKPLNAIDLFKARLASHDAVARSLLRLIHHAGLDLSPHNNWKWWKPGQVGNIGGIEKCQKEAGDALTGRALRTLAAAFEGQVLRYGGTIFAGLWPAMMEIEAGGYCDGNLLVAILAGQDQAAWVADFLALANTLGVHRNRAATMAIRAAYEEALGAGEAAA